jgi:hypothetical protein
VLLQRDKETTWKEIGADTQRGIEFDDITQQDLVMGKVTLHGCLRGKLRVSEKKGSSQSIPAS